MKFDITKKQEKENRKLAEERDEETIPVAKEVIRIIAEANLAMSGINPVQSKDNESYRATAEKVLELMLEKNLKVSDSNFIFQLVLQPFDQIKEIVLMSLKRSFEKAEAKLFGNQYEDIRLKHIDEVIRGKYH